MYFYANGTESAFAKGFLFPGMVLLTPFLFLSFSRILSLPSLLSNCFLERRKVSEWIDPPHPPKHKSPCLLIFCLCGENSEGLEEGLDSGWKDFQSLSLLLGGELPSGTASPGALMLDIC